MKIKSEMATRCELAMMGKVVPVNDNSEVQVMTEYIISVLQETEKIVLMFLKTQSTYTMRTRSST